MRRSVLFPSVLAAGVLVVTAIVSMAGPLDPPAGPVAPTYKTLSEVEPRIAVNAANTPGDAGNQFVISQPGSYYLTGNIAVPSGKGGIRIAAANVRLDLCGFAITGVGGTGTGIILTNLSHRVSISNGTISGFNNDGVDGGFNVQGRYEGLNAFGNGAGLAGRFGIRAGSDATVTNCTSSGNTGGGFSFGDGATVQGCVATGNSDIGFVFAAQGTLTGCTARSNVNMGYSGANFNVLRDCTAVGTSAANSRGFSMGNGCRLSDCTVFGYVSGFLVQTRCVLTGCTASGNAGAGITVGDNCEVMTCAASNNGGVGISAANNVLISGCTANSNASDNIVAFQRCNVVDCVANGSTGGNGINLSFQTNLASRCTANGNFLNGIFAQQRGRVIDSQCRENQQNGIRANFASSVAGCYSDANAVCGIVCDGGGAFEFRDNHCAENGGGANGAGIRVTVGFGRIESNTLMFNYCNLDVAAGSNIIAHNTSSAAGAGGHYAISGGNAYGPVVNVSGVGDISATPGANHPMANYIH